jgi:hypothetical protein
LGRLVFRQKERWSAIDLPEVEPEAGLLKEAGLQEPWEWFITFGGDVRPATPLVGGAGAVVFADEKGGVVCVRPTR